MARPTKLTPELTDELCEILERGNYLETAAEAVGITRQTVYNWMDRGAKGEAPFDAFFDAIARARAKGELSLTSTVLGGDEKGLSFGPAKAAAFMLERTRPDRFAQRVNLKVQEAVSEVLEVVRRVCSAADCERILEELSRGGGGEEVGADPGREGPSVH